MSLEAISRGMEHALICDVSYHHFYDSQKCKTLDVASRVTIWKMDYRQVLAKASQEQEPLIWSIWIPRTRSSRFCIFCSISIRMIW